MSSLRCWLAFYRFFGLRDAVLAERQPGGVTKWLYYGWAVLITLINAMTYYLIILQLLVNDWIMQTDGQHKLLFAVLSYTFNVIQGGLEGVMLRILLTFMPADYLPRLDYVLDKLDNIERNIVLIKSLPSVSNEQVVVKTCRFYRWKRLTVALWMGTYLAMMLYMSWVDWLWVKSLIVRIEDTDEMTCLEWVALYVEPFSDATVNISSTYLATIVLAVELQIWRNLCTLTRLAKLKSRSRELEGHIWRCTLLLVDAQHYFNQQISPYTLVWYSATIVNLVFVMYRVATGLFNSSFYIVLRSVNLCCLLVASCITSDLVNEQKNKLIFHLTIVPTYEDDTIVESEPEAEEGDRIALACHLSRVNIHISALDFYRLDKRLIFTLTGTIVTYVLLLIQFQL